MFPRCSIFRANASEKIGNGHCMRLLALAEGIRDRGGDAIFLLGGHPLEMVALLRGRGFAVEIFTGEIGGTEDVNALCTTAYENNTRTVFVDGYSFGPEYYQKLVAEMHVIAIDDLADQAWSVDLVVNPNYAAEELVYSADETTQVLCGTRFALLRREFLQCDRRAASGSERLLITFGGTDPTGGNARALKALADQRRLEVRVIVGAGFRGDVELGAAVDDARVAGHSVEVIQDPEDMAVQLAWADMAVSACGGTLWELSYLGIVVTAFSVVDNQDSIARSLRKRDLIFGGQRLCVLSDEQVRYEIGTMLADGETRRRRRQRYSRLIDGLGVERILAAVGDLESPQH